MYDHVFSKLANHQIRHQATHKVGCQPGDCIWSLQSSTGVCVGMYGLTCLLYHPEVGEYGQRINKSGPTKECDCQVLAGLFSFSHV